MAHPEKTRRLTHAEYAALEAAASTRHEYYAGQVFAMAGGTPEHSLVASNVTRLLGNLLASKPCVVLNSDASVYVEATDLATYPDATVICGSVKRHPSLENSVVNPVLIVEVLSPSTEAYDRGAKFSHYKRLSTFTEYLLVATDRFHVDRFVREPDGTWRATEASGLTAVVTLAAVEGSISLDEVYAKIELIAGSSEPPSPRPPGVGHRRASSE
jgi:Uma2 family endonuclease